MTEPRTCTRCGERPEAMRPGGIGMGRCSECIAVEAGRAEVGTVSAIEGGKRFRKKLADGSWVACDRDGNELGEYVRGRLADIMDRYKLVPASALLTGAMPTEWNQGGGAKVTSIVRGTIYLPVGGGPMARNDDPDTSKAAASEAARPDRKMKQQLEVLRTIPGVFDEPNQITDGHGALKAGIHPGSFSKRRGELVDAGLVTCTGEGLSPYGRKAMLWTRTAEGEMTLAAVMKEVGS